MLGHILNIIDEITDTIIPSVFPLEILLVFLTRHCTDNPVWFQLFSTNTYMSSHNLFFLFFIFRLVFPQYILMDCFHWYIPMVLTIEKVVLVNITVKYQWKKTVCNSVCICWISGSVLIGGGRGTLCLFWGQILALNSVGKDLKRCLKMAIIACKILKTQGCLIWPLWRDAEVIVVSISQKRPYWGMVKWPSVSCKFCQIWWRDESLNASKK